MSKHEAEKQPSQNSKTAKLRRVNVLHKMADAERTVLAIGKTFRFPGSGNAYQVQVSGAVVRANPKHKQAQSPRRPYQKANVKRPMGRLWVWPRGRSGPHAAPAGLQDQTPAEGSRPTLIGVAL
jgi:hypothetical protein